MKIQIRKFDERIDTRIVEYQPDRTIIHTAGGTLSALFGKSEFLEVFTPDGFWIALDDEQIIGAVLFGRYDEHNPTWARIYGIRVDDPYRQRGIGGILLQKADKYSRMKGIDRTILFTTSDNLASLTLFKKAGYVIANNPNDKVMMVKKMRYR